MLVIAGMSVPYTTHDALNMLNDFFSELFSAIVREILVFLKA